MWLATHNYVLNCARWVVKQALSDQLNDCINHFLHFLLEYNIKIFSQFYGKKYSYLTQPKLKRADWENKAICNQINNLMIAK